ncbi:putative protein KIAA2026 [Dissostichus eleginoides]|uniref:Uncharacterized bromodomain-containing protein 10 helical domain-containing protein n=1 Tax=Dissostichus eleginoides TaxID=100907 RepID=A0AAD9BGY2_DISEL|nr:putative protein KIAA2026 [Dissostichus eleginoides]
MSAKEVEEWEQNLLSQASPHTVDTLWEIPAIGHFLCLAQSALNLPEIVFFDLERSLLMPRCSLLLSKIMSSLLSPSQRRATLHRRPVLPYRRWESELRQRVMGWYRSVGASHNQPGRAEQLGLCHTFFSTLGEVSPMEEKPFHLLPFYQRVWLLKGLCDHVYETQKNVQDALLAQPIHECRESILGYDSKDNAYIHFPHFCGADLRIYCQSPSTTPVSPFPSVWVKRVDIEQGTEGEESDGMKEEGVTGGGGCYEGSMDTGESDDFGKGRAETLRGLKGENGDGQEDNIFKSWSLKKKEEGSESVSSDENSCEDKLDFKKHINSLTLLHTSPIGGSDAGIHLNKETVELEHQAKPRTLKQEQGLSLGSMRTIKAEIQEPCLSVGEHSYTGRSPARLVNLASPMKPIKRGGGSPSQGQQRSSCLDCCKSKTSNVESKEHDCSCGTSGIATQLSSESSQNSSDERVNEKIWPKKKKRKKRRGREQLPRVKGEHKQLQPVDRMRLSPAETTKSALRKVATTINRKDRKRKHKTGKKLESSKKIKDEPSVEPSFKLVCCSLEGLRALISKTEDELDDLESTKKRLGRWYHRREAVKDLHSTLIRLLNELSLWEPKLVKAFQRNRLRLKKECDDFKKHPEYNNFVREEKSEEEDLEHMVPRGLWSGATNREFVAESAGEKMMTYLPPNHLKQSLSSTEKHISPLTRSQAGSSINHSTPESGKHSRFDLRSSNQSKDSISTQAPLLPRTPILHPTTGLPKGYTPIPTLLAKSVGNKGKPTQTVQKNPVQVVYTVPDRLGHLVRKESPVKISVHPVMDQNTGEKIMPQLVILPSKLLINNTEENVFSKGVQVPLSKVASPFCMSTNVPGFTIPENKIPVQQVAPLKYARTPSLSPHLNTAGLRGIQFCSPQASKPQSVMPNPSPIPTPSSAVSTDPDKPTYPKQELKTVCIRDSQSILVTTRGGNTGIVRVQTSSDQNALGSLTNSPVITISPQFKAFLISKTSQAQSAQSQTSPCTVPALTNIPVAPNQEQVPAFTGGIPVTRPGSHTASTTVTGNQGPNTSVALSKGKPSFTKSLPGSRVMFISQPTATSSTTSMGSFPKPTIAPGASGQLLSTSLSGQTLQMASSTGQPVVNSEAFKNITLPSGVQIQLSGKTTTIGQTIGALSRSPTKNTPETIRPSVNTTGLVAVTSSNTITSCSAQLASQASQTPSSKGISSFNMISQPFSSTSTSTTLPAGNINKKAGGMPAGRLFSNSTAQVTTAVQSNLAQTSTSTLVHQHSNIQSGIGQEITSFSPPQTTIPSASTTNTPFTTSTPGTIQQRIVINTSKPLAAGTQILLNNARFVVPPQGLGPGSHVLIISNPAPQKVPTASAASTGASGPAQVASHVTVAGAPSLPQCPARLPGVPASSSPFVACTPAVGPSLLANTSNVPPCPGSTWLPSKTKVVSALPRLPAAQVCNFASPPGGTPSLMSSPPRFGSVPALVSPVVTSAPALSSALTTFRLAAGTPTPAECSTISPAVASPLSRLFAPLSSLPVLSSPSAVARPSPVTLPLSSAGAPALRSSLPAQQVVSATTPGPGTQPQQTAVGIAAYSIAPSQALLHMGLGNIAVKNMAPAVMHPVLAGTRTQVLPTVAVPPIVSAVSRM